MYLYLLMQGMFNVCTCMLLKLTKLGNFQPQNVDYMIKALVIYYCAVFLLLNI